MRPIKHTHLKPENIKGKNVKRFRDCHINYLEHDGKMCFVQTPELVVHAAPTVHNQQYIMDLEVTCPEFYKTLVAVNERIKEIVGIKHAYWDPIRPADTLGGNPHLHCRMSTKKGAQPNFGVYQRIGGRYEQRGAEDIKEGSRVVVIMRLHGILIRKSYFTVLWKIDQVRLAKAVEKPLNEFDAMDFMSNVEVRLDGDCIVDESDVEVLEANECVYGDE